RHQAQAARGRILQPRQRPARQGPLRSRHRRLQPGDQAQGGFRARLRQPVLGARGGRNPQAGARRLQPSAPPDAEQRRDARQPRLHLFKMTHFDAAVSDYDAALRIDPKLAFALYGRGLARLNNGDPSGEADIAAAKALQADIAEEYARYGMQETR